MSLPRHQESQADTLLDMTQILRFNAFKLWVKLDSAKSAQERFILWQRHQMEEPHERVLNVTQKLCLYANTLLFQYKIHPNKRGFTLKTTEHGCHPHTIGNNLEKALSNCFFIGRYTKDSQSIIDHDINLNLESDCDLCLRPALQKPNTRSRKKSDHIFCSQCGMSWCSLCAEIMESETCPYCRKAW